MKFKLKEICTVDWGDTSLTKKSYVENGRYLGVSAGGCDGRMDYYNFEAFTPVISAIGANCGKMFLPEEPFVAIKNTITLNPNKEISGKYLFYAMVNNHIPHRGGGQPFISKADTEEYEIPCPIIDRQQEIVDILDKTKSIIDARKQQLQQLDDLVKARFVEMFGDPVNNSKGLPELTLPELGEFGRGVSKHRPRNDPKLLGGKYPLIQTGEVANSELYITNYENTYSELGLKQSKMWQAGTLCITIAANIAKTAILTFDACFPDSVVGFKANDKTNNIFIHYWFSFFQAILEAQAPESAQKNINLKILSELKIIVPPIEQQNEFASFVEQVDKLKATVQKALDEAQTLFDSLMQEYFG